MRTISQNFKSFLSHIKQFIYDAEGNVWFRGHSNIGEKNNREYILNSSLFRISDDLNAVKRLEQSYIYEFMTKGYSLHQTQSEWDLLYIMQHHGTPTRLMDWTSSLSTALYFATLNWQPDLNKPCIWLLNPSKLNQALKGKDDLIMPTGDFEKYVNASEFASHAIAPIYNSPRLISQQGQFTMQGNYPCGLDEELANKVSYSGDILCKIEITSDLYSDVMTFLHMNGVNDFTVFPDLDGLSKLISKRTRFYK